MAALPQSGYDPAQPDCLARHALEHAFESALVADAAGGLVYANSAARALLGYGPEEFLTRQLSELLPELPLLLAEPGASRETVCQQRDGQRLAVEAALARLVVEEKSYQFVFLREISERKRLQEQLRQARRMEVVGRLVAGVSHDFNNLLTAMLIYTGLLLNQLPAESPLRRPAEQANVAAERGRSLVARLMALGERRDQPTRLSLNEVIESVRDMLTRLLGEPISLEISYGERLGAIWADRNQMEQMLVNLAVNARDAMPEGGLLRIATANFTVDEAAACRYPGMRPGAYVRLAVSDTGRGMDEETRAHVFEPFFTTKPPGQGTGLGLSTVSEIVRQSRGQLILESALGRGTQVQVFLPRVEGEAEMAPAPSRQEARASGAGTVLVVEDEELVRRSLYDILEGKGYRVLQARNAREAMLIDRGYGGAIDLMLADLVLPGLGGPELADELRPQRPDMRVLYISGYCGDARVRRLEQAGRAFFPKPFTAAAIAEKVSEVLAAPHSQAQSAVMPVTAEAAEGH